MKDKKTNNIKCPVCLCQANKNRGAFVEIGAYDETKDVYEDEYYVTEYICTSCRKVFFI